MNVPERVRARVEARLRDDLICWLTTVGAEGQPQPAPVWFWWDGKRFLIYSQPAKPKLRNIAAVPWVALSFDGNGRGGDILVIEGVAVIDATQPSADAVPEYAAKYAERMAANTWTPSSFAADYSVPILVTPRRWRAW